MLLEDLQQQVTEDAKAGRKERASFLRFLLAQIQNVQIERGKGAELSDKDIQDVLRKEAKKRKEAISLYEEGGREDLKAKEEQELEWVEEFLPAAPTEEEIRNTLAEIAKGGVSDFGALMGQAMQRLEGADGTDVARIAKDILE